MPAKYIPTKEKVEEIISLYQSGMSIRQMEFKVQVGRPIISRILKENGIHIRMTNETSRKYTLDETYFEKIDTEDKAYWLGFIYADGFIENKRQHSNQKFGISLAESDIGHLKKFKNALKATYPIKIYSNEWGSFKNCQNICRFIATSQKVVNDLKKAGCVEHKTKVLIFPKEEIVPKELQYAFIRGYLDGDGTIYCSNQSWFFGFVGTYNMIKNIKEILKLETSIHLSHPERCENIYTITGGAKKYFNALYNLYDNASIYLDRKYELYKIIKNKYGESQGTNG